MLVAPQPIWLQCDHSAQGSEDAPGTLSDEAAPNRTQALCPPLLSLSRPGGEFATFHCHLLGCSSPGSPRQEAVVPGPLWNRQPG